MPLMLQVVSFYVPFFTYRVYQFEWALVFGLLLVCGVFRRRAARWLSSLDRLMGRLARQKKLAVLIAGLLPLLIRAALLPVFPIPEPSVHDEFSHLLLADTFASGRITNPPHKLWQHFETIHVISQPTYASMYPPGLGLPMAAAEVLTGQPWWGVWASVGLMCALTCWMLQGWVPPKWAFFGAVLLGLRVGIYSFYMNSYFGGEVPAIGGALVAGALPRIMRHQRAWDAFLLGLGLVILANSRPYESAFIGLGVCVVIALWARKQRKFIPRIFMRRVAAPALTILAAGGLATAYYCWRVTGNPLLLPYEVNRATYGWPVHLAYLKPVKVTHRHPSMHKHYLFEMSTRSYYATPKAFLMTTAVKIQTAWRFLFGPALSIPLLFLPWVLIRRKLRPLAIIALVASFAYVTELFLYPQYLGPVLAILYAFMIQGLRYTYVWAARRHPGFLFGIRALPVLCAGMVCVRLFGGPLVRQVPFWDNPKQGHEHQRAMMLSYLKSLPGPQLVIVRYSPDHDSHKEWVYNAADIDHSKVVWAREMDPASNERLVQYFHDRRVWLLEPDNNPPTLLPFPRAYTKTSQRTSPQGSRP